MVKESFILNVINNICHKANNNKFCIIKLDNYKNVYLCHIKFIYNCHLISYIEKFRSITIIN